MKLMALYRDRLWGAISGLDRVRFRGTLRWLANERGLGTFMHSAGILLKDFSGWAQRLTEQVRQSCEERARQLEIETRYLRRGGVDKEALARQIAAEMKISSGSICLLSVVEPCMAPQVRGNRKRQKLELTMVPRKCVFLYHYFDDPQVGFGHVRIQSWLPFNVFICLNGRHWLERGLRQAGIGYVKDGNCFPWIEDLATAQELLNQQLKTDWTGLLNRLTLGSCPALSQVIRPLRPEYYWSADESEWATDILFKSAHELDGLYPSLLHHAMRISDSPSVLRYFGRRDARGLAPEEVLSDLRRRYEGIRIKHWKNGNSVKMYNKGGSILRIETTINQSRDFKVFRHPNDQADRPASWQKMRKGVSDLHRRCEVSQACNERYGEALAAGQVEEKLEQVAAGVCNRVTKKGKRYRGLNAWQKEDYRLLMFLAQGQHAINGFRNRDLREWLYPEARKATKEEQKKAAGRITRRIKLLRVHGLIRKVPRANRYVLTDKGRQFSCALLSASGLDIKALTEMAA